MPRGDTGAEWIRMGLRGPRRTGERTRLTFRYRLSGAETLQVELRDAAGREHLTAAARQLARDRWAQATLDFDTRRLASVDEVRWLAPAGAALLVDDVLLFEPADKER